MGKKAFVLFMLTAFLGMGSFGVGRASAQDPVVMLIQAQGGVSYSTDGTHWKKVNRNKFLYDGWSVRTEQGASCKLLHQNSNLMEEMDPKTEVVIRVSGTEVVTGSVSRHESSSSLPGQLKRKLAEVQKYTTLHRKAHAEDRLEFGIAEKILVSKQHPDIVWENAGKEYSYRLIVDGDQYPVPGSDKPVIRYTLADMQPGKHSYQVQILFEGEVLFTPDQGGTLVWMDQEQNKKIEDKISKLRDVDGENGYLLGNLYDDEGMAVVAMDQYQAYLKEHPDANEVRPFLVKVLHNLGLDALRENETLLFKQNEDKIQE